MNTLLLNKKKKTLKCKKIRTASQRDISPHVGCLSKILISFDQMLRTLQFKGLQTITQSRRDPRVHQSSHLIIASSCFLFLWSQPASCFLVTSLPPVQTLGQNNTATALEATRKTDGNVHTPLTISHAICQIRQSNGTLLIAVPDLFFFFLLCTFARNNKITSENSRLERHRSSGKCDRRLIIADR